MKRILIVENGAGFGGALTSLAALLERLDPTRFEVHLFSSYPQKIITARGAVRRVGVWERKRLYGPQSRLESSLRPIFRQRAGNVSFLADHLSTGRAFAKKAAAYARVNRIDLIQGNNGILINDAVILGAARAKLPCVIHARSGEYPGRVGAWLALRVARVLAVSNYVADTVQKLGVPDERIALVAEGLDAPRFAKSADARAFRARYGIPDDCPVIGMVACLVGWKGHEVFLRACADVLPRFNAKSVIVGGEPDGSGRYLAKLRAMARDLGLGDRVVFTGHEPGVASAMAACQVVVHASTSPEPFGRVLLEAMAVGRPVVAAKAGGAAEVVEHGQDGLLVAPGNVSELAGAMRLLLGDAPLRTRLGRAGREKVGRYSIVNHTAKVEAVWENLTAGPHDPANKKGK